MIYTVTFAPAIDYAMYLEKFVQGEVNRTEKTVVSPGGKGINVSVVLKNLGLSNVALGFTAGFTGREIQRLLNEVGVHTDFIEVEGLSRINVKLKSDRETDINASGAIVSKEAAAELIYKLKKLKRGDTVVLAGKPSGVADDIYESIMENLSDMGIRFVIDSEKEYLLKTLKFHPFLVKPNKRELGEMFGVDIREQNEIEAYARRLMELGAKNVIVSLAGDGAMGLFENGKRYFGPAPDGKAVNSVGAGDSLVAGFLYGYERTLDFKEAFRYGIATGSATAFGESLAIKEEIEKLYEEIKI